MAGKAKYRYPTKLELEKLLDESSVRAVAKRLGCSDPALRSHLGKEGITLPREAWQKVLEVSVHDPDRIRGDQDQATIKALKRENAEYAKALASQEQFFDRIVEATKVPVRKVRYPVRRQDTKLPRRSVICPLYDMQFGSLVRASETPGGKGNFNTAVFDERLARYVDRTTAHIRTQALGYQLEELIFVFGGDHVEGDEIFPGMTWQIELDPPRQVWELAVKMTEAMRKIVQFAREEIGFKRIACYGTVGNHGKVGGKRSGSRPLTYSWDWLFLKLLFDRLEGEAIDEMVIDPAGLFFYAAGIEFQAVHGEHIKGWGGLPFYGIARFDAKSVRMHNRLYRYLLMGHHHQAAQMTTGSGAETIVSGDWVGATSLSGVITAASRPQQAILYVSANMGVAETARIYLTDASVANEPSPIYGIAA